MSHESLPDQAWTEGRPPPGRSGWSWQPTGLDDLPRVRREFRHRMASGLGGHAPPSSDGLEDAVLVLDELMGNAIRHGRAPVRAEIRACEAGLVVLVSDRAPDVPPRPTSTRDPALGGMGLGIVARASTTNGWFSYGDVKVVWALLP